MRLDNFHSRPNPHQIATRGLIRLRGCRGNRWRGIHLRCKDSDHLPAHRNYPTLRSRQGVVYRIARRLFAIAISVVTRLIHGGAMAIRLTCRLLIPTARLISCLSAPARPDFLLAT